MKAVEIPDLLGKKGKGKGEGQIESKLFYQQMPSQDSNRAILTILSRKSFLFKVL